MDYPRSDRHLLEGVRRLTRIESKSVEQVVSFGDDDMYNYPTLYAVEVGHWKLHEEDAKQLREYLLRGGFLMVDDFHGSNALDHDQGINEWQIFTNSMSMVFPDREIVDIPNNDPIFHTIFDLNDRFQVPGAQYFETGPDLRERSYRARIRTGAASTTTTAASWSPSATTWIWATPGSIPTKPAIWRNGRRSPIGSR